MQRAWSISVGIILVGSVNAAVAAGIAANPEGRSILVTKKAQPELVLENTKDSTMAVAFVYSGDEDLLPLLENPDDKRVEKNDFGRHAADKFREDLLDFNSGRSSAGEQAFDPMSKDSKGTPGLNLPNSNWAPITDIGRFRACPATTDMTFTCDALTVSKSAGIAEERGIRNARPLCVRGTGRPILRRVFWSIGAVWSHPRIDVPALAPVHISLHMTRWKSPSSRRMEIGEVHDEDQQG